MVLTYSLLKTCTALETIHKAEAAFRGGSVQEDVSRVLTDCTSFPRWKMQLLTMQEASQQFTNPGRGGEQEPYQRRLQITSLRYGLRRGSGGASIPLQLRERDKGGSNWHADDLDLHRVSRRDERPPSSFLAA